MRDWSGLVVPTVLIMRALRGTGQERLTGYGQAAITKRMGHGTAGHRRGGSIASEQLLFTGGKARQEVITWLEIIGSGYQTMERGCSVVHTQATAIWDISSRPHTINSGT